MQINLYTEYVDDLMSETIRRCREQIVEETDPQNIPPPLSSQYEQPDKKKAIQHHKSRFSLWSNTHYRNLNPFLYYLH